MKYFITSFMLLLVTFCWIAPATSQDIYFDDSPADLIILGNSMYYEIGFRKSNGGIVYITDKSTGQYVSMGSRYECLWGAVFPAGTPDYVGGCNYHAAGTSTFSYSWSPDTETLTLNYTPDPSSTQQVTAEVLVTASTAPWFDMRLELQNEWGYVLDYTLFPSDLVFVEDDIEEALLPILPGVVFEPSFFEQDRSYTAKYPGYPGLFADYFSLTSSQGHFALYSLYGSAPLSPLVMGLIHDDEYLNDSTYYYHTFGTRIDTGQTWTTPWVRIRISQSFVESITAYRADNGLGQLASLPEKLGSSYHQVVQSPLFKADAAQLAIPFSQYGEMLSQLPTPGILHPVAFQPNGHDENYPDFLPPNPAWGTTNDFAMMFQEAQMMGFLVMPYTNPTWWDDQSPTLQNLPPPTVITDVAVLNNQNIPFYEYYGAHGGYVVSPHDPFVQQRLEELVISMTADVPSNLFFEDQIGARPWPFDHHPASPDPMAYIEGWLEHTRVYSPTLLMTELGFDRLAETEVGFHGSILLPQRLGYTADWWGIDTWHSYPLAPMMTRDKTLFYQHDLAPETFTTDKVTLTWNLAFGYMLSYDLVESSFGGGVTSEWLGLVAAFQKNVLAYYAGEPITDFANLEGQVTQTSFETYTVIANWDETNTFSIGAHTLPPLGVLVNSVDGTLTAGIFTQYNDFPLSLGDHYLIEARELNKITVYQPVGADTSLTLTLLSGWQPGEQIEVRAYTANDLMIQSIPVTAAAQGVTFVYQQQIAGQSVAYYKVVKPFGIFLPFALRVAEGLRIE